MLTYSLVYLIYIWSIKRDLHEMVSQSQNLFLSICIESGGKVSRAFCQFSACFLSFFPVLELNSERLKQYIHKLSLRHGVRCESGAQVEEMLLSAGGKTSTPPSKWTTTGPRWWNYIPRSKQQSTRGSPETHGLLAEIYQHLWGVLGRITMRYFWNVSRVRYFQSAGCSSFPTAQKSDPGLQKKKTTTTGSQFLCSLWTTRIVEMFGKQT